MSQQHYILSQDSEINPHHALRAKVSSKIQVLDLADKAVGWTLLGDIVNIIKSCKTLKEVRLHEEDLEALKRIAAQNLSEITKAMEENYIQQYALLKQMEQTHDALCILQFIFPDEEDYKTQAQLLNELVTQAQDKHLDVLFLKVPEIKELMGMAIAAAKVNHSKIALAILAEEGAQITQDQDLRKAYCPHELTLLEPFIPEAKKIAEAKEKQIRAQFETFREHPTPQKSISTAPLTSSPTPAATSKVDHTCILDAFNAGNILNFNDAVSKCSYEDRSLALFALMKRTTPLNESHKKMLVSLLKQGANPSWGFQQHSFGMFKRGVEECALDYCFNNYNTIPNPAYFAVILLIHTDADKLSDAHKTFFCSWSIKGDMRNALLDYLKLITNEEGELLLQKSLAKSPFSACAYTTIIDTKTSVTNSFLNMFGAGKKDTDTSKTRDLLDTELEALQKKEHMEHN